MNYHALILLFAAILIMVTPAIAEEKSSPNAETGQPEIEYVPADTSNWEYSLRTSLTGTQSTYKNWSQGGTDNISVIASSGFSAKYAKDIYAYDLSVNLRYGQTQLGDDDFIKSDDLIRIRNQVRRKFRDERFSTIFNLNFESQFTDGHHQDNPDSLMSGFFAPAYLSQVLGFSYNPDRNLRFEAGLAMKQTFVRYPELATRYGLPEGDSFRNEAGFSTLIGFERRIMESIYYEGFVETFTNVNKSLTSTDVLFVNQLTGRINRYFSANVEFALAYNDDIIDELQVKQIISIGFNYSFFED